MTDIERDMVRDFRHLVYWESMCIDPCGGRGPGEGCLCCDTYHRIQEALDRAYPETAGDR